MEQAEVDMNGKLIKDASGNYTEYGLKVLEEERARAEREMEGYYRETKSAPPEKPTIFEYNQDGSIKDIVNSGEPISSLRGYVQEKVGAVQETPTTNTTSSNEPPHSEPQAPNRYSGSPDPSLWGTSGSKEVKKQNSENPNKASSNVSSKINNHIFNEEASQFGPTAGSYNSGYTEGTFNPNSEQYFKDGHKTVNPKPSQEPQTPNRYSGSPDPSLWGTSGAKEAKKQSKTTGRYSGIPDPSLWGTSGSKEAKKQAKTAERYSGMPNPSLWGTSGTTEKKSTKISNPKNNRGSQNSDTKSLKTASHLSSKGYLSSTGNFGTISIPKLQNPPTFDEYDHWAGQMAIAMKNVADRIPAVVSDLESNESTVRAGSDGANVIAIADKVKTAKDNLNKYRNQLVSEADYVVRMARSINDTKLNAIQNEIKKTMVDTTILNGLSTSSNVEVLGYDGGNHYKITLETSHIKTAFDKHGRRPEAADIESRKSYVKTLVAAKAQAVVQSGKDNIKDYEIIFK